ncbi:MAG: PAS domain-containing protein [Chloroflexi bacterium]|nr:PAS domain-containing protein [Chloroflexota bacterium]
MKSKNMPETASPAMTPGVFHALVENAADFVALCTPAGQIMAINENGRMLFTLFDESEVANLNLIDLVVEDEQMVWETAVTTAIENRRLARRIKPAQHGRHRDPPSLYASSPTAIQRGSLPPSLSLAPISLTENGSKNPCWKAKPASAAPLKIPPGHGPPHQRRPLPPGQRRHDKHAWLCAARDS